MFISTTGHRLLQHRVHVGLFDTIFILYLSSMTQTLQQQQQQQQL